jgi:radical SAM protein with 4Fe4S-binding SPASM domain
LTPAKDTARATRQNFPRIMNSAGLIDDRPRHVVWEVCREGRHAPGLAADQSTRLIDQIAGIAPRRFTLAGDLASRDDFSALVARANDHGLHVDLQPTVTPRLLRLDFDALREAGARRLTLGIHGASAASHGGRRGSWERALDALALARRARIPVQIHTVFSRCNAAEWPALVRLVMRLQPAPWCVSFLVPGRRGEGSELLDPLSAETLLRALISAHAEKHISVRAVEIPQFRRIAIEAGAHLGENDERRGLFVSHRGEIQPSAALPIACGNVKSHYLLDVYRNAPIFRRLRNPALLKGKCGRCEFRMICGGSRARAYAVTGDYLAEEPTCPHQPHRAIPGEWAAVSRL